MTAATEAKRETWRDLLARGGLPAETIDQIDRTGTITRDELLERLRDGGVEVSVHDLENWQQAGFIPYGVRRWHRGATRVLYPWWMVDVIRSLRMLQREGLAPLNRIAPLLTIQALKLAKHVDDLPVPSVPPDLEQQLRRWVAHHVDTYGIPIKYAEIRLVDERGHPLTFRFDIPE